MILFLIKSLLKISVVRGQGHIFLIKNGDTSKGEEKLKNIIQDISFISVKRPNHNLQYRFSFKIQQENLTFIQIFFNRFVTNIMLKSFQMFRLLKNMAKQSLCFCSKVKKVAAFLTLFLLCVNANAGSITNMRVGQQAGSVRIVLEADADFDYKAFLLSEPKRLVVDVFETDVKANLQSDKNSLVSNTRIGNLESGGKRIVFDLRQPALIKKAFMLKPQSNMKWRFVIDVALSTERDFKNNVGIKNAFMSQNSKEIKVASADNGWFSSDKPKPSKARKKIIVLDPGHGGKDPGAIGAYGKTYEKNITLAMGKELKAMLEKQGYTVYLTRSTDIFIPLRQRVKIAQKYKADLFVSIHADSALNRKAKGLSVYTLSETASDKEAAALAERENKVDIIGGIDFSENSREINDILISLSQTDSRNKSSKFAGYMVNEMRKTVDIVDNTHRFAGFAVLKAPDIPSALLEMGYLSNRQEETLLKQGSYRKKLANSVTKAINKYFNDPEIATLY